MKGDVVFLRREAHTLSSQACGLEWKLRSIEGREKRINREWAS
jgi:hypothetical protein